MTIVFLILSLLLEIIAIAGGIVFSVIFGNRRKIGFMVVCILAALIALVALVLTGCTVLLLLGID